MLLRADAAAKRGTRRQDHARTRALGRDRVRCRRRECLDRAVARYAACVLTLFTMSNSAVSSFPRRVAAPGFFALPLFASPAPTEGAGGAPGGGILSRRALRKGAHHVCETRPSGANRNGPLGAPTLAILGPGRAFESPELPPDPSRGGSRTSRARLRAAAGTPHLAPPAGSSPETPLTSQDAPNVAMTQYEVNIKIRTVVDHKIVIGRSRNRSDGVTDRRAMMMFSTTSCRLPSARGPDFHRGCARCKVERRRPGGQVTAWP
jgi:hypothetical protein